MKKMKNFMMMVMSAMFVVFIAVFVGYNYYTNGGGLVRSIIAAMVMTTLLFVVYGLDCYVKTRQSMQKR